MKKTRILSVLALASMVAACSNEEIVVSEKVQQDLSVRPVVENSTIADANESRLAVTGKYRPGFQDGDKLGAVLIDEPVYTSQNNYAALKGYPNYVPTIELYNVVEKAYSNYPYERVDGAWYTQAELVEGNYMFYAPYNEANSSIRSTPVVKLPMKQTVTSKTSAIDEFAASGEIVKVGYAFMDASGSMRPTVAMQDVFAYPTITLKNNFKGYLFDKRSGYSATLTPTLYEGEIRVDSIQIFVNNGSGNIKTTKDDLTQAALKFGDGTHSFADDMVSGLVYTLRDADGANSNPWYVNAYSNAFTDDILDDAKQNKTRKVLTTLVLGKTMAKGATETFNVVLPAREYGDDLSARVIVTIAGKQYQINNAYLNNTAWTVADKALVATAKDATTWFTNSSNSVTLVKAQQYPAEEYTVDGEEKTIAGQTMVIDLKGGVLSGYATAEAAGDITPATVQAGFEWDPTAPVATGISTNAELISWFKNTTRGAQYQEVASADLTSDVKFNLLANNSLKINAELIEALYTANFINNTVTGSLEFSSILPIASDVRMTQVAQSGSKATITFVSLAAPTKYYKITIPVATATANITANGNYILDGTTITKVNSGNTSAPLTKVNIINPAATTTTIDLTAITDGAYISSLNNLGTLKLDDLQGGQLTIVNSATLELIDGKKTNAVINNVSNFNNNGTLMVPAINNGTITTDATSTTKVSAGTGTISNTDLGAVSVTGGTQTVTYTHTGDLTQVFKNATGYTYIPATAGINKLIVTGDIVVSSPSVITTPIVGSVVTEIEMRGTNFTTNFVTGDLSAVTLNFTQNTSWNGLADGTTITDCKLYTTKKITLTNVSATGTRTGTGGSIQVGDWSSWTNK